MFVEILRRGIDLILELRIDIINVSWCLSWSCLSILIVFILILIFASKCETEEFETVRELIEKVITSYIILFWIYDDQECKN